MFTSLKIALHRGKLGSSDIASRVAAIAALGQIDEPRAMKLITGAVGDPAPAVRKAIIDVLVKRKDPSSGAVLVKLLSDPVADIRIAVVHALGKFNDPVLAIRILDTYSEADVGVRQAARETMEQLTPDDRHRACIAALDTAGSPVALRSAIIECLAGFKDGRVIPQFIKALQDGDRQVWIAAAKALCADNIPRANVISALSESRAAVVIGRFIGGVRDGYADHPSGRVDMVDGALEILLALPFGALSLALDHQEPSVRILTMGLLIARKDPRSAEAFFKCWKDPDPHTRHYARTCLESADPEIVFSAFATLVGHMTEPNDTAHAAVAYLLLTQKEVLIDRLIKALDDPDRTIKFFTAMVLKQSTHAQASRPEIREKVEQLIEHELKQRKKDEAAQLAALKKMARASSAAYSSGSSDKSVL